MGQTERGRRDIKVPRFQRQMVDWLDLNTRHPVYILFEVDITDVRDGIRQYRRQAGGSLSLTAYLTWCFAAAIGEHKLMHAYAKGRKKITIFDDVDVAVTVERDLEGFKIPLPIIVRGADRLAPAQIDAQIASAKNKPAPQEWAHRWLGLWLAFPAVVRRFILRRIVANPERRRRIAGTAMVSATGMFARGGGWGISPPSYTVSLLVGMVLKKPFVVENRVEPREVLSLTVCFDHDIVDGAVAVRFTNRFKEIIEAGAPLRDAEAEPGHSRPAPILDPAAV